MRLEFDPDAARPAWRIELQARGLQGREGLLLDLADWGEWLRLDDYYLRALECEPPLRRRADGHSFDVLAPADWDGVLRARYELAVTTLGSVARESFGLLPYRAPTYAFGFADNTLAALEWDGMPADVAREVEIVVPDHWTIASGYAAPVHGRLRARVSPGFGNTALGFGVPVSQARAVVGGVPLHVVQFGGTQPVAEPLAGFAAGYLQACTQSLGVPPARPLTLIVTEPGHGGTRTDGAIAVGCPAGFDGDADAYTLHFLAHELFHDWLGGQLQSTQGERLAWFWEGFTEYASLWHLAQQGAVSRAWFAQRVLDWEADLANNAAWGELAFADPDVDWRDGEIEPLAYQGSALLAFELDVTLRAAGKPGLMELLRALLAQDGGRYGVESIRNWLVAEGLQDFWDAGFATPRRVDPHPLLRASGFLEVQRPRRLAYVGVRLDRDGPFGEFVAVDPDGPAAGIVQVGDVVSGLTPTHEPIAGASAAVPEYPFGLAYYETVGRVRIDVERGEEHMQLWVRPTIVDGPPQPGFEPGPALGDFFR
ncbi:MAG: hypothetical protein FJ296_08650 [Planctomycetes bacterium]|nr:hypothetical protein [Planctomycetota bacterium]